MVSSLEEGTQLEGALFINLSLVNWIHLVNLKLNDTEDLLGFSS